MSGPDKPTLALEMKRSPANCRQTNEGGLGSCVDAMQNDGQRESMHVADPRVLKLNIRIVKAVKKIS